VMMIKKSIELSTVMKNVLVTKKRQMMVSLLVKMANTVLILIKTRKIQA
jgi:hypothetical protein